MATSTALVVAPSSTTEHTSTMVKPGVVDCGDATSAEEVSLVLADIRRYLRYLSMISGAILALLIGSIGAFCAITSQYDVLRPARLNALTAKTSFVVEDALVVVASARQFTEFVKDALSDDGISGAVAYNISGVHRLAAANSSTSGHRRLLDVGCYQPTSIQELAKALLQTANNNFAAVDVTVRAPGLQT